MTAYALPRPRHRSDLRRLAALSRAELRLFTRNPTAMVNTLLVPLVMAGLFAFVGQGSLPLGPLVVTVITAMGMIFVVYYTLVTTLVARRQELVLKRLRTGEAPPWVIIAAGAVPLLGLLLAQVLLGVIAAAVAVGLGVPVNPLLVLAGVLLGALVWVLLAVVSSAFTKTVESAQITTLPVLLVPLLGSGLSFPITALPDALQRIAELTPLHPVVELLRLGFTGGDLAAAGPPLLVLVGWLVVGTVAARRCFRWDPRS